MRIKGLEIENFKLFDRKFGNVRDISDASLVLFNGPNGYGKTSIFDAIEFALTGRIKRIDKYSKELGVKKTEGYNKKILIADETKEAYIKLYLKDVNSEIELQRIYSPSNIQIRKSLKENNPHSIFDKFERKIIVDGKEIIELDEIEKKLKELNLEQIEDFYDKCCFISQDESLGFLKEAHKEKATALDFLFKIPIEIQDESNRVNKLIESLKNNNRTNNLGYITKLEKVKKGIESEIQLLNEDIIRGADQKETKIRYECLFPKVRVYWDADTMILDGKKYDEAMVEIDKLIYFSENQESCLNYLYNKPFKDIIRPFNGSEKDIHKENPLEYTFRYYPLVMDEKIIETEYFLNQEYGLLQENIIKRKLDRINWNFVSTEKLLEEDIITIIKEDLEKVAKLEKTQGVVSKAVINITDTRITLMKYINDAVKQSIIDENKCPLCGASYEMKQVLDQKIKEETDILQALCDDSSKEVKDVLDGLYKEYFDDLLRKIEKRLKETISETVYNKLQEVKENKFVINKTKELLQKLNVVLPELYEEDVVKIDNSYKEFVLSITSKLKEVSEEIELGLFDRDFIHKYEVYYDNNKDKFKAITSQMLRSKIEYIKLSFYNSSMKELSEKNKILKRTNYRIVELSRIYNELKEYQDAIQVGIKNYKKKIIHDIEPLLYVYTAKILQQKFNGKSIYIKTDDDMENMHFINSVNDEQDILYNMSSGQLAAVSLSFLLCMNQVYAKKHLSVLLIDDPIQTIDDVNMVGLVDILRHEFYDRQIFISTHEQKFEWYLKYKYEKKGDIVKSFNMKDLLLRSDN